MTVSRTLTLDQLQRAGACQNARDLFAALFGDSVEVTEVLCVTHAMEFNWGWAAESFLSRSAKKDYRATLSDAGTIYDSAIAPALAVYAAATAPAKKAYRAACTTPPWASYSTGTAPARAIYDAAIAPAQASYDAAIAEAWAAYRAAIAEAEVAYDAANAVAWAQAYINDTNA